MIRKKILLIMLLFSSFFLVSCSKDKIDNKLFKNNNISLSDDLELVFSKKQKVKNDGKNFIQALSIYKYEGSTSKFFEQFDENASMSNEKNSGLENLFKNYYGFNVPDEYKCSFTNDEYEWRLLTLNLTVFHFKNKNMIYIFALS